MGVEKQARMGNDVPSLKEVCLFTVRLVRCVAFFAPPGACGWAEGLISRSTELYDARYGPTLPPPSINPTQ